MAPVGVMSPPLSAAASDQRGGGLSTADDFSVEEFRSVEYIFFSFVKSSRSSQFLCILGDLDTDDLYMPEGMSIILYIHFLSTK